LQYAIGVWQEVAEGDIIKCGGNGLHFCEHPSGVWAYYNETGTRVFHCEAEYVLEEPVTPGADRKLVARRLRLLEEIVIGGYSNTGNYNTGYRNTGNYNTGYGNATDNSSGFFEIAEPKVSSFGTQTELTKYEFMRRHPEYYDLCIALGKDDQIPLTQYQNIPGITQEKLLALHAKHIEGRKKAAK
jgi:hypothetical protein